MSNLDGLIQQGWALKYGVLQQQANTAAADVAARAAYSKALASAIPSEIGLRGAQTNQINMMTPAQVALLGAQRTALESSTAWDNAERFNSLGPGPQALNPRLATQVSSNPYPQGGVSKPTASASGGMVSGQPAETASGTSVNAGPLLRPNMLYEPMTGTYRPIPPSLGYMPRLGTMLPNYNYTAPTFGDIDQQR